MRVPPWLTASPIAHRGLYDAENAENSLAAFRCATALGVPFEFDVQVSQDGELFVLHDADLSRVVGEPTAPLADLGARQVRALRVALGGAPVPSLDDVLELVDGAVALVVDVRRWQVTLDDRLERAVAERLRRYPGPFVVQSFDPVVVYRMRRLLPDTAVGQISGSLRSAGRVRRALGRSMVSNVLTRPDYLAYELAELPSRVVSFWRGPDRPVIAFTAQSPEQEITAKTLADNVFFSGYRPAAYR